MPLTRYVIKIKMLNSSEPKWPTYKNVDVSFPSFLPSLFLFNFLLEAGPSKNSTGPRIKNFDLQLLLSSDSETVHLVLPLDLTFFSFWKLEVGVVF